MGQTDKLSSHLRVFQEEHWQINGQKKPQSKTRRSVSVLNLFPSPAYASAATLRPAQKATCRLLHAAPGTCVAHFLLVWATADLVLLASECLPWNVNHLPMRWFETCRDELVQRAAPLVEWRGPRRPCGLWGRRWIGALLLTSFDSRRQQQRVWCSACSRMPLLPRAALQRAPH